MYRCNRHLCLLMMLLQNNRIQLNVSNLIRWIMTERMQQKSNNRFSRKEMFFDIFQR